MFELGLVLDRMTLVPLPANMPESKVISGAFSISSTSPFKTDQQLSGAETYCIIECPATSSIRRDPSLHRVRMGKASDMCLTWVLILHI
jgi:hypothetical protein